MVEKEIEVTKRPSTVSWEEISVVLRKAHEDNVSKGIFLPYPQLPPRELENKTEGRGGVMFVALHNGKVIGTGAVAIIEKSLWCGGGKYAYCFLDAVLPEYSGEGVYRSIVMAQESHAKSCGVSRMLFDTDVRNNRILSISKKNGYKYVDYKIRDKRSSVLLVKWLDGCPYSNIYIWLKYQRIRLARIISDRKLR